MALERFDDLDVKCWLLLKRAVLTLFTVPDPDAKYRRQPGCSLPPILPAIGEIDFAELLRITSGEVPPRVRRFTPTPKDLSRYLEVLSWLNHLAQAPGGERDVRVLIARAYSVPWWRLSQRYSRSEQTIQRWFRGAVRALAQRHAKVVKKLADDDPALKIGSDRR